MGQDVRGEDDQAFAFHINSHIPLVHDELFVSRPSLIPSFTKWKR